MLTWWQELIAGSSLFAALISAFVSYVVARRSVYITAVTAERSKWIDALRQSISKMSGAADRVSSRRKSRGYQDTEAWSTDTQAMRTVLSELTLHLNPSEAEACNLLRAAKKLDQAARLHTPAAVLLADEIMVRHGQWVLKAEWDRVKKEAAGIWQRPMFWLRERRRRKDYNAFLTKDGCLSRLDVIGAGKTDLELTFLRSEMDTGRPAVQQITSSAA